ncbi:heparan-alpha-glucosaminide N-acetyltransferase domain-containing protein [Microbacterium sp. SS28]|uniref:heparan-alpha-glucosaminide N-acetyltransferase domain-containing protein n=1 Tax=Microbacterium sp. SS28 TaxID=2919948 RepID=UPI001FA97382|nr:heparan-alpha-glucosaminide N-acetyltransferase domain-containing protein [Microbacterium sp. SS28]
MNAVRSTPADEVAPPAATREWLASRWERLNGPARIPGVDLARGLAVIGMLAAHLFTIDRLVWADPSTWAGVVQGRSSILFATLAGVSIGLVTGARTPYEGERMSTARKRLVVRASLLWVLGILLIATGTPIVVILPAYAILFLLAIPLTRLTARTLFVLAGALALATPVLAESIDRLPFWDGDVGEIVEMALGWRYPFVSWITFVVAGLAIARAGVRRTRVQVWLVVAGGSLAVLSAVIDVATGSKSDSRSATLWESIWLAGAHTGGILEIVGSGGFALAAVGICLLVCRTFVVWIVLPLRAVGSMPLTAYVAQVLAWAVVAWLVFGDPGRLFAFRSLEPFPAFTIGILIACTIWALTLGRGPLEWVTDQVARFIVPGASFWTAGSPGLASPPASSTDAPSTAAAAPPAPSAPEAGPDRLER